MQLQKQQLTVSLIRKKLRVMKHLTCKNVQDVLLGLEKDMHMIAAGVAKFQVFKVSC